MTTTQRPGLALVTAAQAKAVTQDAIKGIDKMIAQSEKFDTHKQEFTGDAKDFHFTSAGKLQYTNVTKMRGIVIAEPSKPMGFTDHAFSQMLARFSKSFFGEEANNTMKREDWKQIQADYPKFFAAMMNDTLAKYADKSRNNGLMMRTYGKEIRAIFTSMYGIVNNTDMLKALHAILSEAKDGLPEMKLVRSEVTQDDLLVQVVWRNVKGENPEANRPGDGASLGVPNTYGVGIAIRNGETGKNGIKVSPMIWRHSCTNSIIIKDDQALNLRHVGVQSALISTVKVGMMQMLPIAQTALKQIFDAEVTRLPNLADIINGFAQEYKWSDTITDAVMIGTEGQTTKMGVVNGISYAAHAATEGNTDLMVDMSTLAGTLLGSNISVFNRAAQRTK